MFYTVNILF